MRSKCTRSALALLLASFFFAGLCMAQDPVHEEAMSMLRAFFADPAARADYAAKNPAAAQAEGNLAQFPPDIQKRLEKVVLMILEEEGAAASSHVDALGASGPEGAFRSFSPAVQKEIEAIARELEKDPEFVKKAGSLR